MALFETFSQPDRFKYDSLGFQVLVPNIHKPGYIPRASAAELRRLVFPPKIRLTRAGHISTFQEERPVDPHFTFYIGQLIHYGLPFVWERETAKRILRDAITTHSLTVPQKLQDLEESLKKQFQSISVEIGLAGQKRKRSNSESPITSPTKLIDRLDRSKPHTVPRRREGTIYRRSLDASTPIGRPSTKSRQVQTGSPVQRGRPAEHGLMSPSTTPHAENHSEDAEKESSSESDNSDTETGAQSDSDEEQEENEQAMEQISVDSSSTEDDTSVEDDSDTDEETSFHPNVTQTSKRDGSVTTSEDSDESYESAVSSPTRLKEIVTSDDDDPSQMEDSSSSEDDSRSSDQSSSGDDSSSEESEDEERTTSEEQIKRTDARKSGREVEDSSSESDSESDGDEGEGLGRATSVTSGEASSKSDDAEDSSSHYDQNSDISSKTVKQTIQSATPKAAASQTPDSSAKQRRAENNYGLGFIYSDSPSSRTSAATTPALTLSQSQSQILDAVVISVPVRHKPTTTKAIRKSKSQNYNWSPSSQMDTHIIRHESITEAYNNVLAAEPNSKRRKLGVSVNERPLGDIAGHWTMYSPSFKQTYKPKRRLSLDLAVDKDTNTIWGAFDFEPFNGVLRMRPVPTKASTSPIKVVCAGLEGREQSSFGGERCDGEAVFFADGYLKLRLRFGDFGEAELMGSTEGGGMCDIRDITDLEDGFHSYKFMKAFRGKGQ